MNVKINGKELLDVLRKTPSEQNIMLVGNHGIGKSEIITRYFEEAGQKVVTLFLGQMSDPGDIIGLPHLNEKTDRTEFMPPYWFPTDDKPIVLFLDELNRARPEVLQTIMDLTLNRKLAGRELPEGSRIISAVNGGEEYNLTDLDPALVSRFNIYTFSPNTEDWLDWAEKNEIDKRIISFIRRNPKYLDSPSELPEDNLEKCQDRRAWVRVSNIIKESKTLTQSDLKIISGIIGEETALKFVTSENRVSGLEANELLEKGKKAFAPMLKFTLADFSTIILGLFEILSSGNPLPDNYAKNFSAFIEWLNSTKKFEALAFMVTKLNDKNFFKANAYISENCPEAYEVLEEFMTNFTTEKQ